jgi:hypothetical protein
VAGLFGDSLFTVVRLHPIELIAPSDGTEIDGLAAKDHGVAFSWVSPNPAPSYQLLVRRASDDAVVADQKTAGSQALILLPPGEYQWAIHGALEGFDLSPRAQNRLVVAAIPRLPAAESLLPADQAVYGPDQLRAQPALEFSWASVPGAHEYRFRLFSVDGDQSKPLFQASVHEPKVVLSDLTILHRGRFRWEVEALTRGADGEVEQSGLVAAANFVIDLPALEAPQLSPDRTYYVR